MTPEAYQQISQRLPRDPGIYKYYDAKGELLYVGKAKNIHKRVSSYFTKSQSSWKTKELVSRIHRIEFTIVDSEQDAFFLENALIKEHQPRFNIDLKDDKTYPYIIIKKEAFPRVFLTRKKILDGSEYLGPFTSVGKVRELLDFIRQTIPLRTCKLNLSPLQVAKGKYKVCLEYHLGNCKGPCEAKQDEQDYEADLRQVRNILKGKLEPVADQIRQTMEKFAAGMEFEKAELARKKLMYLEEYKVRSVIVSNRSIHADIFALLREGDHACVSCLMVHEGTIFQTHTVQLETRLDESDEEVLIFAIGQLRTTLESRSPEIIVPFPLHYPDHRLQVTVPLAGEKKKLLDLAQKNADFFVKELRVKKLLHSEGKKESALMEVLYQLQEDLQLPDVPLHIECFDNSHFQGSFPVSAMVCFRNGMPSKADYRRFNVKTVVGIDDFATMKEVVYRRYKRLLEEKQPLPQLVIIDGGKGQLHAAMESIETLGLTGSLTMIGLAKNEEEIFFPGDTESLKLEYQNEGLKLIRRIRDEVHRFGITFHRKKRSAGTFTNELEKIEGIGKATAETLLQNFQSVKKIRTLPVEKIAEVIGLKKAEKVKSYLEKNP